MQLKVPAVSLLLPFESTGLANWSQLCQSPLPGFTWRFSLSLLHPPITEFSTGIHPAWTTEDTNLFSHVSAKVKHFLSLLLSRSALNSSQHHKYVDFYIKICTFLAEIWTCGKQPVFQCGGKWLKRRFGSESTLSSMCSSSPGPCLIVVQPLFV